MLEPMTEKEVSLTVKNILAACKDIEKLNSRGYKYLHLQSGFIAHYNIFGFRDFYSTTSLKDKILKDKENNIRNYRNKEDKDFDYYEQKSYIYRCVCNHLTLK